MRYLLLLCLALAACGAPAPAVAPQAAELRYLLPPDFFSAFVVVDEAQNYADDQGFLVRFVALGAAPGPQTTLTIAGGAAAQATWEAAQAAGKSDTNEQTIVRAVDGWVTTTGPSAITMTWFEAGHPYFVSIPSLDDGALQMFVNSLATPSLSIWRDQVGIE